MSDLVVSQHIDDLLDSLNASQSRAVLDVPKTADVPSINSFNNLQNFVNNINGSLINVLSLSGYTYTLKLSDLGYYRLPKWIRSISRVIISHCKFFDRTS